MQVHCVACDKRDRERKRDRKVHVATTRNLPDTPSDKCAGTATLEQADLHLERPLESQAETHKPDWRVSRFR